MYRLKGKKLFTLYHAQSYGRQFNKIPSLYTSGSHTCYFFFFCLVAQQPHPSRLTLEVSKSHSDTTHTTRGIGPSQRPLPDTIQNSQQTFMPPAVFVPAISASEWPQTFALDRGSAANLCCVHTVFYSASAIKGTSLGKPTHYTAGISHVFYHSHIH